MGVVDFDGARMAARDVNPLPCYKIKFDESADLCILVMFRLNGLVKKGAAAVRIRPVPLIS